MIHDLTEVLPSVIAGLERPLQREICSYLLSLAGKRRPTYTHAQKTWALSKIDFDQELAATMMALRDGLRRRGIHRVSDVDIA